MALAWLFRRTKPAEAATADRALGLLVKEPGIVPVLWHAEVVNGLVVAERRKVISPAEGADFLSKLSRLPIETDAVPVDARREIVMALAREYSLTAYDATYLDVAMRTGSRLASFDADLNTAVHRAGGKTL